MVGAIETELEGTALLTDPLLNEQVSRRLLALRKFETNLERYLFLRGLQDSNETLCYALLTRNITHCSRGTSRSCFRSSTRQPSAKAARSSAIIRATRAGCS